MKISRGVWIGLIVIGALIAPVAAAYLIVETRLNRIYEIPAEELNIPADPESIARGEHLTTRLLGCTDCHGDDLGGEMLYNDPLFGQIAASNLTRGAGGIGAQYSDLDWEHALRHGVNHEGRPLIFVMASFYARFSDQDTAAVIAYLKQVPAVDRELPATVIGPLGRFFILTDPTLLPAQVIDHDHGPLARPEPAVSAEYGKYLATACTICHGTDFSGGLNVGSGLNLTPGGDLRDWTEEDFLRTLQTGVIPSGRQLDPDLMPWKRIGRLADSELRAIWLHLQSLPALHNPNP